MGACDWCGCRRELWSPGNVCSQVCMEARSRAAGQHARAVHGVRSLPKRLQTSVCGVCTLDLRRESAMICRATEYDNLSQGKLGKTPEKVPRPQNPGAPSESKPRASGGLCNQMVI